MEKRILMSLRCTRSFGLILIMAMLPLHATTAAAAGEPKDPALEAIQALEQTAGPETTVADPAPAQEPPTATPGIAEVPATPEDTQSTAAPTPVQETPVTKDIVLVLDNSGSMKKNDPEFIAKQAVVEFISGLDEATRVAVIIFDQTVRVAVPLVDMSETTRETILQSLDQINYKGLYTDSPAGIERAIYELKTNGRMDAQKIIVFMTDGIVDTGNAEQDREKAKWLKEELAADAADSAIRIFGIAYTENADFYLIQSIAQATGGEYYRALQAAELNNVFTQVFTLINKRPETEPKPLAAAPEPPQAVAPPPPPAPIIIEVPVQPQPESKGARLNSMLIMAALAVMIIAVIFLVLMVMRTSRRKSADEIVAPEAQLNDIHGYTAQTSYKLGSMPTILGRTAGTDTDHMNYIVIPQTTIGRRHALIEYKDYAYWIVDQGSINGTFVNDQMITGETRLKHGDRVRLHKYEFEFVMPEMVEAGMTVISQTVMAKPGVAQASAVTVARAGASAAGDITNTSEPEPDFDLSDMAPPESHATDVEDTVLKGSASGAGDEKTGDDETLMLDTEGSDTSTTDATLRPDDHDDADLTVDNIKDNDKTR